VQKPLWSSNTGGPVPPGTGRGFIAGLHAAGRFTGLFFGGSLTPLALDPADAIAL
jgi:hypothetical protein